MTEINVDVIEDLDPAEIRWDDLSDVQLEERISKEGDRSGKTYC